MVLHYLLLFYRNTVRHTGTFLINLIGLSSGLVTVLLIYLWASDEFSVDKFHVYAPRLFQVVYNEKTEHGIQTTNQTPYFLEDALRDIPEIELTSVATPQLFFPDFVVSAGDKQTRAVGKFAGKEFFRMFSYALREGIPEKVLADKNAVVISESLAKKLFNSVENLSGKILTYNLMNVEKQVIVSGVFMDIPNNASEQFDFVLSFDIMKELMGMPADNYAWNRTDPFCNYVLVREGTDGDKLNEKLHNYIASKSKDSPFSMFLKPYADNYLYSNYENGEASGGRIDYVILFSIVGLFILLIACVNFITLSTAQANTRLKQISIKKIVGATRKALLLESFAETICLSFVSLAVALVIADLILPQFNLLTGKHLHFLFDGKFVAVLVAIAILTGILAGLYPATYLSSFHPSKIVKEKNPNSFANVWVRKGLVVFQFALSVVFIIGVIVIYQQVNFIQSKKLGYAKDHLLFIDADGAIASNVNGFLNDIKRINGVSNASSMIGNLVGSANGLPGFVEYDNKKITIYAMGVNYDMLETLGVEMKQGRAFSQTLDEHQGSSRWILNEAAAQAIGDQNPVGKIVGGREVIGIVKNFHFQSLHETIKPFAFYLEPNNAVSIWVRIQAGKEKETIAHLNERYAAFDSTLPFNFNFADQVYKAQYVAETRIALLAKYFAAIAIIISCLGLIGLVAFTTERRRKEIGVRKILGSSEAAIVRLISRDFTMIVLTGISIGIPISYLMASWWLKSFAYTIHLQWWYFIFGGGAALLLTWITVGTFAMKAARANPTESLKYE